MFTVRKSLKALLLGAAAGTVLLGGCTTHQGVSWQNASEPNPDKALVMAGPGLGASDALGAAIFVEDGTRFAAAEMVFEMASAESPDSNINVAELFPNIDDKLNAIPRQVIVSGNPVIETAEVKTAPSKTQTADVPTE